MATKSPPQKCPPESFSPVHRVQAVLPSPLFWQQGSRIYNRRGEHPVLGQEWDGTGTSWYSRFQAESQMPTVSTVSTVSTTNNGRDRLFQLNGMHKNCIIPNITAKAVEKSNRLAITAFRGLTAWGINTGDHPLVGQQAFFALRHCFSNLLPGE
jgi:hypothetical protein